MYITRMQKDFVRILKKKKKIGEHYDLCVQGD